MKTPDFQLVVLPKKIRSLPGTFTWQKKPVLASCRDSDELPLRQLADDLRQNQKLRPTISFNASGSGDLIIMRDSTIKDREAYRIDITADGIRIMTADTAGAYYAIQTLREIVTLYDTEIPCCRIDDAPDFKRRGVYYDVARGKVPHVETLKNLIEHLAHWKINEFQIYIKNTFTWKAHPSIGKGYSPYSPEDILAIQAHCRLHHVRFVPSMATLSHYELILQQPQYRHLAEMPGYNGWEGGTMLCPTDPKSFKFVRELHNEYAPLFDAEDFNVCCDEPWELGRGRSKRTADRIGRGKVYLNFLLKLHRHCQKLGKRMNIWGDIVLKYPELIKEIPKDVVMLNWDYSAKGSHIPRTKEFVDAGLSVIACPGTSGWQRHGTDLPNAMGNVTNFARTARRLGIDGILNTDWGDFGHRNSLGVSLHGYAHGAAHAWNTRAVDDELFTDIFCLHTFRDTDRMPDAIKIMGECASLALPGDSRCLYHALVEPLKLPTNRFLKKFRRVPLVSHYPQNFPNFIDKASPEGLHAVVELLSQEILPEAGSQLPEFEQRAIADYHIALLMDLLAAEHAIIGRAYRSGKSLSAQTYSGWADSMEMLTEGFEVIWLMNNRPSRLHENLKLMRLAGAECRRIAQKI